MHSLIDRIDSVKFGLLCSQAIGRQIDYSPIYSRVEDFQKGINFLARFVDCIRYRSNALELAPHLGSVVTKVEASVQKIGDEFREELNGDESTFMFFFHCSQKKISILINLFDEWINMVRALKPDVRDALDSLSIHSVHCKISFHDFPKWRKFIISTYMHLQGSATLTTTVNLGAVKPSYLESLLGNLENYNIKDPKIEAFLTKFGSSVISAELLYCQLWSSERYFFEVNKVIKAALQDLERMIWLTYPEFVDVILRVLKTTQEFSTIAKFVVNSYIASKEDIVFNTLGSELKSLTSCVLNMPKRAAHGNKRAKYAEEDDMMVKMFLSDTKELLMETVSLYEVKDKGVAKGVARNLIEKIWLIKIEILLRTQITGDNKVNMNIDSLNDTVRVIKESSSDGSTASTNMILILMEEVAKEAPELGKSATKLVRNLLLKTLHCKGELMFLKLHDSLSGSFKDYIESLHEGFKFMMPCVIDQQGENLNGGKTGFAVVESVATRIITLYRQILDQENISEEMLINMKASSIPDLLDEIKLIMNELKGSYLSFQMPVFPYTNAVGFSDSLRGKLREFLNYEMDLVKSIITKKQISDIFELLEFFLPFLQGPLEDTMSQELKNLSTRAVNLTYEAEYLIDSVISGKEADNRCNMIWLYHFLQETRDLKIKLSQNQGKRTNKVKVHMISRETTPDINEDVVRLVDEEQCIIDLLVGGFGKLSSVSIVGMPGIGKTTLAKKVYNSPEVVNRFWMRAWCCVSEVYRRRDVLLEILSHMIAIRADIMGMTDEDLEFKLYKILKTKRYLIVLDDVWGTEVLDDLVRRFPDNEDDSRILITSRNEHVALKANPDVDPHRLRQLHDNESWMLLQKKIFHEESCPDELKEIGEEIAASCRGLPLAVIAIAGLLERIERQQNRWKDIAESLSSKIIDDPQEQWRRTLELSYENLPDCLKACFLYFGAFLEDQDIPAWKLIQLWIAEGFVPKTELKTMEDVAEDYLMDLIGRSLVMLSKQSSLGGAKACRIHDVLRKLCQSKAKEDKFLQVVTRSDASNNATLHDLDNFLTANFGYPTNSAVTYEDHRLCFCSKRKHFIDSRPLGPHVRSLLCFADGDLDPKYPYDISFISENFRFLKVLDLECINMGTSFAEDILLLVQLKYLAVAGYIPSIPSSIANLWNLETLIVKGLREKVNLPHQLWSLKRLRHVRVCDFAALDFDGNSSQVQLDCLVTAASLILPSCEETDCFLKKCHNLRKLKCIFFKSPRVAADQNSNQFPSLKVLNELESLKITYYGRDVGSGDFSFPSNLKKLTLSNFQLPWGKISVIGGLQKLEVLKLLSQAFVGEEWEMVEGEFLQLKYLKLDSLDFAKWNANGDNLPKLKKLVLRSCKNLEIPVDILDVPALQIIDVQWCGENVEKSARQIGEDGNENLKVFINFAELQFP